MAGFDPYAADEAGLARKQKMADLLGGQAMQPIEQFGYGGIPAPISPAAGLAKVLQAWGSRRKSGQVDEGTAALNQRKGADTTADYSDLAAAMKTGKMDPTTFGNYRTPEGRDRAFKLYEDQLKVAASGGDPNAVREWKYYSALSPEDQSRYQDMKRANPTFDLGDVRVRTDQVTGAVKDQYAVGAPPKTDIDNTNNRAVVAPPVQGAPRPNFPMVPNINASPGAGAALTAPAAAPAPAAQPAPGPAASAIPLPPRPQDKEAAVKLQAGLEQTKNAKELQQGAIKQLIDLATAHPTQAQMYPYDTAIPFVAGAAKDMKSLLASVDARNFLGALGNLKNASPNGASGLGSLTESEGQALRSAIANLNPAAPNFVEQLKLLSTQYDKMWDLANKAVAGQSNVLLGGNASAPGGGLPQGVTEDDIAETMRANNMTRDQVLQRLNGR